MDTLVLKKGQREVQEYGEKDQVGYQSSQLDWCSKRKHTFHANER